MAKIFQLNPVIRILLELIQIQLDQVLMVGVHLKPVESAFEDTFFPHLLSITGTAQSYH